MGCNISSIHALQPQLLLLEKDYINKFIEREKKFWVILGGGFHPLLLYLASNIKALFDASSNSQCLHPTCVTPRTFAINVINIELTHATEGLRKV